MEKKNYAEATDVLWYMFSCDVKNIFQLLLEVCTLYMKLGVAISQAQKVVPEWCGNET
jgi:hypothetical protein